MNQQTLSDIEYGNRRHTTRRDHFLSLMDELVPWGKWVERIRPYYPAGRRGRPPKKIETMLRMYLMQIWYGLSAARIEDVVYDSYAMRSFMHIDFLKEQAPGSSTLLRFKHLIEEKGIAEELLADIDARLEERGVVLKQGSIVDAKLVERGACHH